MRWFVASPALCTLALFVCGCGSDDGDSASNTGGGGGIIATGGSGGSSAAGGTIGTGGNGGTGTGGAGGLGQGCGSTVIGIGRDFKTTHPDFECTKDRVQGKYTDPVGKDCGPWDPDIVGALGSAIGPNRKPVYTGGTGTKSTTGKANFDQWFNDAPGVNASDKVILNLKSQAGSTFVYDTDRFFPLDGKLFDADPGNPDKGAFLDDDLKARNFHFTYELHITFKHKPASEFTFRGDDDVFVYIADKLVVNLAGIHVPLQGKLNLDTGRLEITAPLGFPTLALAPSLGFTESIPGGVAGTMPLSLTAGEVYPLDFFFAERNCCASNFRIETNLEFVDCGGVPR